MTAEDFAIEVRRAQELSNTLKGEVKLILRKALPHVEALQRDNTHFSPRLMSVMLSKSESGISAAARAALGSTIQSLEEFDPLLFSWLLALKNGTHGSESDADTKKRRDAVQRLETSQQELRQAFG
jgi:hypothetical protein